MKLFAICVLLSQAGAWVEASKCRTSPCNAGIAKAVGCNSNKPNQCANAIGCPNFYSTTVYRGCSTGTVTVTKAGKKTTSTAFTTTTITKDQPSAESTDTVTQTVFNTIATETSFETTVVATATVTTITTVATETTTITTFTTTNTIVVNDSETLTASATVTTGVPPNVGPGAMRRRDAGTAEIRTKHPPTPAEIAAQNQALSEQGETLERRDPNSKINYPKNAPYGIKSCLNPQSYSAACACYGAQPKTVVKPSTTKVVTKTVSGRAVTKTTTSTITSTATNPQVTKLITVTTTFVQEATATETEIDSITSTDIEIQQTTAQESTILTTETATTTTNTITQTVTQTETVTVTQNPFPAGGSCGCRQSYTVGARFPDGADQIINTSIQPTFQDCALVCDNIFACNTLDYDLRTGVCRLANQIYNSVPDANFYYGIVLFERNCGPSCSG